MARRGSLRFSIVAGLLALQMLVLGGLSWSLYARASRIEHEALYNDASVRARALAAILELDADGHELDLDPSAVQEYSQEGEPVFACIVDAAGKVVVRSPSLADRDLVPTAPWDAGTVAHEELVPGPFGVPCAAATYSFLVRADGSKRWTPPPEADRRYRIQVAVDARGRDRALASLGWFLAVVIGVALLVTLGGGLLLARIVLTPVRRMTEDALAVDPESGEGGLEPSSVVAELRTLAETLNDAFDRLRSALARQRRFTADAGHELRTPVSILMSNTDVLLRRERTAEEYVEGLELQRRTIGRMRKLVEDLLTLARADSSRDAPQPRPTLLAPLLEELRAELRPVATSRDVTLDVHGDADLAARCDPAALLRVLRNLAGNGLKFTPAGGRVDVSVERDGDAVRIAVEDTGPGIPPGARARVFDRFHRVHDGQHEGEGTGLGLAIAKSLVEAQAGTLEVTDGAGGGAAFVVRLPAAEAPAGARRRVPAGT